MSTPPSSQVIQLDAVTHRFSNDQGVYELSLAVPPGTIFGLIGPSGSGKTTTVRLMTGLYAPTEGAIRVLGHEPRNFSAKLRAQIGYIPQQFVLYQNLTVWENLSFVASLYGMSYFSRRPAMERVLEFTELDTARNRLVSQLSGGMRHRLSLACALVHSPQLIFADEPTSGIDPVLRGKFWDYFRELRDAGQTLFVTTQYVGEAAYCDYVGVMRDGRLLYVDSPDGLRRRALGGEVITLQLEPAQLREAASILEQAPEVNEVRRARGDPGQLNVYVAQASTALPAIFALLGSYPHITVRQAEEFRPSFDDVFIRLMEQEKAHA
jgi:ABC-2 type transport system ATP-binding protein